MNRERFRHLVSEAIDTIPARFREHLQNVAILVEDEPSEEVLEDLGVEPPYTLFGLYHGVPLTQRGWDHGNRLPDTISIYQFPIEDACETEDEVVTQIGETVIHEVGHFFGFDEDELREIERRYWRDRTGRDPEGELWDEGSEDEDDDPGEGEPGEKR